MTSDANNFNGHHLPGLLMICLGALAACSPAEQPESSPPVAAADQGPEPAALPDTGLGSFKHVTVGVADLDVALDLWVENFGFEIVAQREGADPGLATLWALTPQEISRQALVRTPGQDHGMLHFVEFVDPDPPVRAGAEVFDMVPKNLDISARDLPERFAEMLAAGQTFRTETYKEAPTASGGAFREGHMKGHDDTNLVLLETVGGGAPPDWYTPAGYAAVTAIITIVPDAVAERDFYQDAMGLKLVSESLLTGPEIVAMIGLPPGSGLDLRLLGGPEPFGKVEIIEYQGVRGTNLYPKAKPKALGTLHINFMAADLTPLRTRLAAAQIPATDYGNVATVFGEGEAISFYTPAGMRIEVHERK